MMFWKNASTDEKPSWYDASAEIVKRKRRIPERREAVAIVTRRPNLGMSTVQ